MISHKIYYYQINCEPYVLYVLMGLTIITKEVLVYEDFIIINTWGIFKVSIHPLGG